MFIMSLREKIFRIFWMKFDTQKDKKLSLNYFVSHEQLFKNLPEIFHQKCSQPVIAFGDLLLCFWKSKRVLCILCPGQNVEKSDRKRGKYNSKGVYQYLDVAPKCWVKIHQV